MEDWIIMLSCHTKEFIRVHPERVPYFLSIGWKEAWEFYREKFNEREVLNTQLDNEMAEIKRQIDELERKG